MKSTRIRKRLFLELRLNSLMAFFFIAFSFVVFRLFHIQVLNHKKYVEMAQSQYWAVQNVESPRGRIFSSDGFLLAGTKDSYLMYGEPKVVQNKDQTARVLAEILTEFDKSSLDVSTEENNDVHDFGSYYRDIFDSLNLDLYWVPLKRDLTPEQMERIKSLDIEGIGFQKEPKRYYPEGVLASHVLGFVAGDERGEKRGYYGIEGALNDDLRGKPGKVLEEKDATGNPILAGGYRESSAIPGRDIVLTIDRSVQYMVEKKIKEGVEKYNALSGSVIVMDPYTGRVIAMANYPTYDPSMFWVEEPENSENSVDKEEVQRKRIERRNLAIQQTYEPGSVMKPMTVSAAVDLGLVNANTTYEDAGPVYYSGHKVDNWDFKHHGILTITQLLEKSNNIGAAWVGHKVGVERLREYLANFGFGKRTGIELEGEDTGILRDASTWTDIDLANISFGQGISATPLQVLNAFNVIANGGQLYQPQIISQIHDGKKILDMKPKPIRRVISKETAEEMVKMLENAAENGEARYFVLKDYKIAGKTGTAQIFKNGEYAPDDTNATFVGFFSGEKRISLIVKLEEPKTSIYASLTAVPLWMEIATELAKFYGIAPDKVPAVSQSQ